MRKAYEDHPSDLVHNVYDAPHLQDSAADWFALTATDYWLQPWDRAEAQEVSARKYARARYAMGLRANDYDWESNQ